jgi:hypothetical protein
MRARDWALTSGLLLAAVGIGGAYVQSAGGRDAAEAEAIQAAQKIIDGKRIDCAVWRLIPIEGHVVVITCTDAQKFSIDTDAGTVTQIY